MTPTAKAGRAFSRPLLVDSVPDDGLATTIEAEPAECVGVAREIDVPALASLEATFRIARRSGGRLQVEGELAARLTQTCIVTLEHFESDIAAPISVLFAPQAEAPHGRRADKGRGRDRTPAPTPVAPVDVGQADPPDPIVDGRIDLGVLAVEFLTLSLDFYPRKPGVRFDDVVVDEKDAPKPSAFAALERFKDRS